MKHQALFSFKDKKVKKKINKMSSAAILLGTLRVNLCKTGSLIIIYRQETYCFHSITRLHLGQCTVTRAQNILSGTGEN